MNTKQDQILRMERTFDCTPEEMWAAWTDPKQLARWISPFPGVDAEIHELDARQGGRIRFTMVDDKGNVFPEEKGVYEVFDPPRELVQFSANDDRDDIFKDHPQRMKVRLERVGPDRTKILFETNLPADFPLEMARGGFTACFDKLETMLTGAAPETRHRRIYATYFMTLDGVVQDPHHWSFPFWNEESANFKDEELRKTDILLLGRSTYDGFAEAWPSRKGDWFSDKFNAMPKYVFSNTKKTLDWQNSHVLSGDLEHEIRDLQAAGGDDIGVHGSVSVTRWLMERDMLDELRILLYPIALGKGLRLFDGETPMNLELVESKPFASGVVSLVYRRAPKPEGAEKPVEVQYADARKRTKHLEQGSE